MKKIRTEIAELSFDERASTINIKMLEGAEMNLENTRKHYELIKKLTSDKPYLALVDATYFFTIDKPALKYTSLPGTINKRIATAYYNPILANSFTTEFFRKFYKPPLPTRSFKTKEEAKLWLKKEEKQITESEKAVQITG
jgi:hypothetical protein